MCMFGSAIACVIRECQRREATLLARRMRCQQYGISAFQLVLRVKAHAFLSDKQLSVYIMHF